MKRSDFLKKFGLVFGAGLIVPRALIPKYEAIDLKPIIVKKFDSISVIKNDWYHRDLARRVYDEYKMGLWFPKCNNWEDVEKYVKCSNSI